MEAEAASRGERGPLPSAFLHVIDEAAPTDNLPAALTTFVGRRREAAAARDLLASSRLVTLTGVGGIGKTRLALDVARAEVGGHPGGVWFVELASLSDPGLVAPAVAAAAAIRGGTVDDLVRGLGGPGPTLLVLDNCEHLIGACAELCQALLPACARLRVLATSREPLRLPGEAVWQVPPLRTPDAGRLFRDRAASVAEGFEMTARNAEVVAAVCRRLDGIPLAIELAAAWAAVLPVEEIADRLASRLGLLTRGYRSATPRQRTLGGAFDWSYQLLNDGERALFRRLSAFTGGFDVEGATAVCPGATLDVLGRLVDTSLVAVADPVRGRGRYRMLETVREYAGRALMSVPGEADDARRRHALHFLAFAEAARARVQGPEQATGLDLLEADRDNLLLALEWGRERDSGLMCRLAVALGQFWFLRNHHAAGSRWLAETLRVEPLAPELRAGALTWSGVLAWRRGDYDDAWPLLERAIAAWREHDVPVELARALGTAGSTADARGDAVAAARLFDEELAVATRSGDVPAISTALVNQGVFALGRGDLPTARTRLEENLALCDEFGDRYENGHGIFWLALVTFEMGDLDQAAALLRRGVRIAVELGQRSGLGAALGVAAGLAAARGRPERALLLAGASDALLQATGMALSPDRRNRYEAWLLPARRALARRSAALHEEGRRLSASSAATFAMSDLDRPDQSRPAERRDVELSRREQEVARLVATGITNREIGERLGISVRTVESHVSSVLGKLGLPSRARLAAMWAARATG